MKENSFSREQIVLQSLVNCGHTILKSTSFKQSAQSVYEACKDMIGATAGYVALLSADETLNEILFQDMGGLPCSVNPDLPMPIRGFRAKAYFKRDVMYENNFPQSEWAQYLPKGHCQLDNVLFAPLVIDEKAVGILGFGNKSGGFCDDDVLVVKAFAELAAVGLLKNRTLESLQKNVSHLSALMQTANDAIVTVDQRGKVSFWNKSAESSFGYSSDEIIGQPCMKIIPENYRTAHQEAFAKAVNSGVSKLAGRQLEVHALKKDGETVPVELSMSRWEFDGAVFFTGIIRDISKRKQMDEEVKGAEQRLREVFKFMKGGGGIYKAVDDGEDFIIVDFYRPDIEDLRTDNESLIGKRILDVFPASKEYGLLDVFQRVWKTGVSEHHPVTIFDSGEIVGWRENYVYRISSGEIVAVYEDITEKKQKEIEIHGSWKLFRTIFEISPDAINITSLHDGKFIVVNQRFLELTDFTKNETIGKTADDIGLWYDPGEREKFFGQIFDKGQVKDFEARFRRKDGIILTVQVFAKMIDYYDKPHLLTVTRDITEIRNTDQALLSAHQELAERYEVTTGKLKESEVKYSTLVEALLTGIFLCVGEKIVFANLQFMEFFGYTKNELLNMNVHDLIHPEDRDFFRALLENSQCTTNTESDYKFRGLTKHGYTLYLLGRTTSFEHQGRQAILGNVTNITEYKLAKKELRRVQINYRMIADYTYDWEWWTNLDGTFRYVSPACERITGYKADRFIENDSLLREIIVPEDREKWDKHDNESNKDVGLREMQFRIKRPNGEVRWIEHACQPVFTRENEFLGFRASNRDITERKQAEDALRENRKRLVKAEQVARMGFLDLNLKTNEIILSREVCDLYGIDLGIQITVEQIIEMVHPDDIEFVNENLDSAIKGSRKYNIDHRIVRPDGKVIWVHARADLELDKDGRPGSLIGTVIDITERKLAEQKLQESEVNLVKAQEVAHIGSWNLDLLDNKLIWTDENYRIFGIPKGTPLTYEKFLEIVHPEDRDYVDEKWHAAIKGELYDIEHRLLIDNELKWVREKAELMFDDKGNPICGVGITQDITDRKLAEISVQKSREALSALSAQLLSAEEKERKRIARDIHDGVGQALSAIKFSVENSLSSLTEESNQAARNALNNIVPLTQQTIEEVRRIVMDLRPSILDDLGLKATISWFCREFEVIYTDISIEQAINFEESNIDVPLKTVVYRILQEAFNNAAKHSRTEYILLRIEKTTDNLELLIEDKGIGFDVNEVELREINQRGVGLASMRERALLSGGTFDIKSSLREGTRVYASWPTTSMSIDRQKKPAE